MPMLYPKGEEAYASYFNVDCTQWFPCKEYCVETKGNNTVEKPDKHYFS